MSNDRLADLNVDVADIAFYKKFPALGGHDDAVIARERCRHHTNPEDDGGRRLSRLPDADDVGASPLHLHRVQKDMELESQVAFLGPRERVVADGAKFLDLRYASGPVDAFHEVVPVRATKNGAEGRPA